MLGSEAITMGSHVICNCITMGIGFCPSNIPTSPLPNLQNVAEMYFITKISQKCMSFVTMQVVTRWAVETDPNWSQMWKFEYGTVNKVWQRLL